MGYNNGSWLPWNSARSGQSRVENAHDTAELGTMRNLCAGAGVLGQHMRRFTMRLLFGIVLGGILTVGGAYLYDSHNRLAENAGAGVQRSLVNWDVVGTKWDRLTERARAEWNRHAG